MNLDETVQTFLENLVRKCGAQGQRILVAFSGGPDSTALLDLLVTTSAAWGGEIVAAHIHHGLRNSANKDEAFCRRFCSDRAISLFVQHVDIRQYVHQEKVSVETAARELRYRALNRILVEQNCDLLALGHHKDDQAETVLGNLLRGTGLRGLAGMQFRTDKKIRPLLNLYQEEILRYLQAKHLAYCVDESNVDTKYKRNDIRHNLMPLLQKDYNPQIVDGLVKLSQISGEAEEYLMHQAAHAFYHIKTDESPTKIVLDIDGFRSYFGGLQKYILRLVIEKLTCNQVKPSFSDLDRIQAGLGKNKIGTLVPLHGKWEVLIEHDFLVFRPIAKIEFDLQIELGKETHHRSEWSITATEKKPGFDFLKEAGQNCQFVDQNKIQGNIGIRNMRTGDSFYPLGVGGKKSISNYFTDKKIPQHKRAEIPIVYCDTGIIWIVGHHLDERFKITSQTTSIIQFEFKEKNL